MAKIHPQAIVETTNVGEGTSIWAFAHIMPGVSIGSGCNIGDHAFIETGAVIGNNVTVKNQALIWEGVTIEDNVFVGPRVTFTNDRFPRSPRMPEVGNRYQAKENWLLPTVVRQGCTIGAGTIICPGVELGAYCVVAAGTVVTKNVPKFSLIMGNPGRFYRFVCTCGQPLDGHWKEADCPHCGESGYNRARRFNPEI